LSKNRAVLGLNKNISPEGKQVNVVKPYQKHNPTPKSSTAELPVFPSNVTPDTQNVSKPPENPTRKRNYRSISTNEPIKLDFTAIEFFKKIAETDRSFIKISRKLTEIETAGVMNSIAAICEKIKIFQNKKQSLIKTTPVALSRKNFTWRADTSSQNAPEDQNSHTILTSEHLKQADLCSVSGQLVGLMAVLDERILDEQILDGQVENPQNNEFLVNFIKILENVKSTSENIQNYNNSQTQNILSRKIKPLLLDLLKNNSSLSEKLIATTIFQEFSSDLFVETDCVWIDGSEEMSVYRENLRKINSFDCRSLTSIVSIQKRNPDWSKKDQIMLCQAWDSFVFPEETTDSDESIVENFCKTLEQRLKQSLKSIKRQLDLLLDQQDKQI